MSAISDALVVAALRRWMHHALVDISSAIAHSVICGITAECLFSLGLSMDRLGDG